MSSTSSPGPIQRSLAMIGGPALDVLDFIGGVTYLVLDSATWIGRSLVQRDIRFGRTALWSQMVRVGTRSIGVVTLVAMCIGLILALQMAPPLEPWGQVERVADIIAVAIFRELGPLMSAIVLTGFAGASIAAELGTMVVGEEIEALEAHALNPIRFLVVPRLIATTVSLVVLTVFAELVAVGSGWLIGVTLLEIPSAVYIDNTITQLQLSDFFTGLWKAGVFGLLLGAIACYNGLNVTGGAAGVGRATTGTVVYSIVGIIFTDLIFTALFYVLGWN
ncbi:MAG: ABC transporter permease [Phycisphaeraceae bacterium]|nr:ABC transporter permease [Phycisphaeraceae bacterium]